MAKLWEYSNFFLASRLGIEIFMNNKGKVVAEPMDEKWLWDFPLLCDISHHLNKELQGQKTQSFIQESMMCTYMM
jgi:hypothetical protein